MIKLISPADHSICVVVQKPVKDYLNEMNSVPKGYSFDSKLPDNDIATYFDSKNNYRNNPVYFEWEKGKGKTYTLWISMYPTFIILDRYKTTENSIYVYHLTPNNCYYFKVVSEDDESEVFTFKTTDDPLMFTIGSLKNVRDLGGDRTKDGKQIWYRRLYRGYELVDKPYDCSQDEINWGHHHKKTLSKESKACLINKLGVKTELDLRTDWEANNQVASDLGPSVKYVRIPINAYLNCLGIDKGGVPDKNAREQYRKIFKLLADHNNYPIYFHCWGGADRTGTLAFLIKGLLGVAYQDLIRDYELTSFSGALRTRKEVESKYTTFPEMIRGFIEHYCEDGDLDIQKAITNYLVNFLGITMEEITNIKLTLLDDIIIPWGYW